MKEATIIGSGLAGTLIGLYLAKRGYQLALFDSRSDPRLQSSDNGRSINLALSCRGITGMAGVGIMPKVEKLMVPMRARAIHEVQGHIRLQAFGRAHNEYINAIQRNELNRLLLNELEQYTQIKLHFNTRLIALDVEKRMATFALASGNRVQQSYTRLLGADGASSCVREQLQRLKLIQASRVFLPYGYKELSIAQPAQNHLAHEQLHLWPRDAFLLLGNPNPNQSITGSLFLAYEGKNSFANLDNELKISAFFKDSFPDAYAQMPNLIEEFTQHPTGSMSTIKCDPWYYQDQCMLLGDAAHGVVPFFGQGMNSAFEDCRILNELLDVYQEDWAKVMPAFYQLRKVNTDAVAQMSLDNFHEIQVDIRDMRFHFKKQVEQRLMQRYPKEYLSKHVLVMFTNTPYAQAQAQGVWQENFLDKICNQLTRIEALDWVKIEKELKKYDKNMTKIN